MAPDNHDHEGSTINSNSDGTKQTWPQRKHDHQQWWHQTTTTMKQAWPRIIMMALGDHDHQKNITNSNNDGTKWLRPQRKHEQHQQ